MSQTVAITLSGLIAIVHLQNGGLGLVIPQAGKTHHKSVLQWVEAESGKPSEERIDGINVVIQGMTTGSSQVIAQRKWDSDRCPTKEVEGTPNPEDEEKYDWSVEMRCLGTGRQYGKISKSVLANSNYVKSRMDLTAPKITLRSVSLASTGAGKIISRFHEKGNPKNPSDIHLFQATAEAMEVTFEVTPREALVVKGLRISDGKEAWTKYAKFDEESKRYSISFRNDTDANHPDCKKSIVGNTCVSFSQDHFMQYYSFFPGDASPKDRPWPGKYAELSAFLEGGDLGLDSNEKDSLARLFEDAFGIEPMQAGSGGRPICMLASFREGN